MGTQAVPTSQISQSPIVETVMRTYQVVLKCVSQNQREEINYRIRTLEEKQHFLLTQDIVKQAVALYRANPHQTYFTRAVSKKARL